MEARDIGLYLFAIGILMLVVYGIYKLIPTVSYVDPFVASAVVIILLGVILLFVSLIKEKREERMEIREEDMKP
ncbi:MAG: hypothetical protein DRN19_03985 [Thermoplasmata archaeon]|nr:MAG: hypothetical protein FE042_06605 [Thermoplasmata archaeon]RLF50748.1 MAG: hypothetical protein DRN19_03985 [Thermoplasmata archaeon]